jgi:SAM-dependent methyltransferase
MQKEQYKNYQQERIRHWNSVASQAFPRSIGGYYHQRLESIYRFLIPPGQKVLELGCGNGDLLASLRPSLGVGVDFSEQMLASARKNHPDLTFIHDDAASFACSETFDYIILSDLLNDVWDVQAVLENIKKCCHPRTRLVLNIYSRLWQASLFLGQKLGLARPTLPQNWLTVKDVAGLCQLAGFEVFRSWQEILLPLSIPLVSPLFNRFLAKLWPFTQLDLTNFLVARPASAEQPNQNPSVSVVIPARNEAGNIPAVFDRLPQMGQFTEIVFVEGHSSDNTAEVIQAEIRRHPNWKCQFLQQKGRGKGDAVRDGFESACGDILMILDADLTVPPEVLPRFYSALVSAKGDFVNGVRLVYPMEKEAMRFFNFLGNKFFSIAFSWLIGQPVKDTLCGTKVLWKRDYQVIAANRSYFGDFDPFGDFDLLFGAARFNHKIVDMPIRYAERTYGTTNIQRWRHGVLLLNMVLFASRLIKFI